MSLKDLQNQLDNSEPPAQAPSANNQTDDDGNPKIKKDDYSEIDERNSDTINPNDRPEDNKVPIRF